MTYNTYLGIYSSTYIAMLATGTAIECMDSTSGTQYTCTYTCTMYTCTIAILQRTCMVRCQYCNTGIVATWPYCKF